MARTESHVLNPTMQLGLVAFPEDKMLAVQARLKYPVFIEFKSK